MIQHCNDPCPKDFTDIAMFCRANIDFPVFQLQINCTDVDNECQAECLVNETYNYYTANLSESLKGVIIGLYPDPVVTFCRVGNCPTSSPTTSEPTFHSTTTNKDGHIVEATESTLEFGKGSAALNSNRVAMDDPLMIMAYLLIAICTITGIAGCMYLRKRKRSKILINEDELPAVNPRYNRVHTKSNADTIGNDQDHDDHLNQQQSDEEIEKLYDNAADNSKHTKGGTPRKVESIQHHVHDTLGRDVPKDKESLNHDVESDELEEMYQNGDKNDRNTQPIKSTEGEADNVVLYGNVVETYHD